jgi:hypothetical protein
MVALHACGDLHVRLLHLASQQGCPQLAVAPCCYNRIQGEQYKAISTAAQASALQLSIGDLGLPLSEAVTSSARVRRQRDSSMARRLGSTCCSANSGVSMLTCQHLHCRSIG